MRGLGEQSKPLNIPTTYRTAHNSSTGYNSLANSSLARTPASSDIATFHDFSWRGSTSVYQQPRIVPLSYPRYSASPVSESTYPISVFQLSFQVRHFELPSPLVPLSRFSTLVAGVCGRSSVTRGSVFGGADMWSVFTNCDGKIFVYRFANCFWTSERSIIVGTLWQSLVMSFMLIGARLGGCWDILPETIWKWRLLKSVG